MKKQIKSQVVNDGSGLVLDRLAVAVEKPGKTTRKNSEVSRYSETTLKEDVLEANRHIGDHIASATRRSTLIREYLKITHPEVTIRTITRIISKSADNID